MFKKQIFQILYIIVSPLCPASLKRFVSTIDKSNWLIDSQLSPSFRQAQSALIGQLTQNIVIGRTPQAASEMKRHFP